MLSPTHMWTGYFRFFSPVWVPALLMLLLAGLSLPAGIWASPLPRTVAPVVTPTANQESSVNTSQGQVCGTWDLVSTPNGPCCNNFLQDVDTTGTNDAWAVGESGGGPFQPISTLVQHWNGTEWGIMPSPNVGTLDNKLYGVDAISPIDVWAVGDVLDNFTGEQDTLIEHWNGASWTIVPSPSPAYRSHLQSVSAVSANDVWAVGSYGDPGQTLTMHWNGSAWSIVPSPSVGSGNSNSLVRVKAIASNNVWAIGLYGQGNGGYRTLILHWNGSAWSIVPSPNAGSQGNYLRGLAVAAPSDIWAVGTYGDYPNPSQTLVLRWNGSAWSIVPSPNPGVSASLTGVASLGPNKLLAVGSYNPTSNSPARSLTMQWDGSDWTVAPSPNSGAWDNRLSAIAPVSSAEALAVGYFYSINPYAYNTLGMRYIDPCEPPTPTPTGTQLTATPSRTSTPTVTHTPTNTATPVCAIRWNVVNSPNSGSYNILRSVTVVSSNDVWAVGDRGGTTLTEHWNGSEWSIVPSPNAASSYNALYGVTAISANDVWAVGYSESNYLQQTLVLHWNGSEWSIVSSPNAGVGSNLLLGVTAISANDVWAVGNYQGEHNVMKTLTLRWNGTAWSIVPSPNEGGSDNVLHEVSGTSANDVWAVGSSFSGSSPLILRWNGTQWNMVTAPEPQPQTWLIDVEAISPTNAWAVGGTWNYANYRYETLVLRWNGSTWSSVPTPHVGQYSNRLWGISAITANDIWAVGETAGGGIFQTLTMHWDGSEWSAVSSPNVGTGTNRLLEVAAASANDVWAVGQYNASDTTSYTLIERYADSCGGGTSTPVATNTVGTPTATHTMTRTPTPMPSGTIPPTNTPPIATATSSPTVHTPVVPSPTNTSTAAPPTATPCSIEFTDVGENNTFYTNIRCLACRGIVSGYSDGTFRPNNQVTRGQLAKMVSEAARFSEAVSGHTFQDVPSTHTFYTWIERLATRGYMTGYLCGGAGEPCVSGRPYFRPFANATRGQTAKIVANAAGFTEQISGQTFEDVPPTHTFYEFIQRLASRNVMQGYPCGGLGEPCLSGRPYFRHGNDVTRGQSAKIVANSFHPDCVTP